jgi:DNA polymerase-3 subunit epsilon
MGSRRQGDLIIDLINRFFLLRECDDGTFQRKTSCLYSEMKRCQAPCDRDDLAVDYAEEVGRVKRFLMGEDGDRILENLQEAMMTASREMDYELAARYRDSKELVERLLARQRCIAAPVLEHNAVVIDRTLDDGRARFLIIRYGRLVDTVVVSLAASNSGRTCLQDALAKHFGEHAVRPDRYFKAEIEDIRLLIQWLYLNRDALKRVDWDPEASLAPFADRIWSGVAWGAVDS